MAEQFDLKIDLDRLEECAVNQVEMIGRATRLLAHLKRVHAQAENALELTEAQLKRRIRQDPTKYGVPDGKITEGSVNEAMTVHADYQKASNAVIDARYQMDLVQGIVNSLEHRKRMVETEVDLWKQSYFARPAVAAGSTPGVRDKIVAAQKQQIRAKVAPLKRS